MVYGKRISITMFVRANEFEFVVIFGIANISTNNETNGKTKNY